MQVQRNGELPQGTQERNGISGTDRPRHYPLPHDDLERQRQVLHGSSRDVTEEATRLLVQHNMLKNLFENKMLLAPVDLDRGDKVLETGTGSGLWIMDLAATVDSSVPIVGVDIEPRLFPASPPKNIEFRVESVTSLPSEWTDTFSLVHQRLLLLGLQESQWPKALQEIHRVLRPGGWVQLAEHAPWRECPGQPYLGKLAHLYRSLMASRSLYFDCAYRIPKMLEEAGFVDIQSESRMQAIGKWGGEFGVASAVNQIGLLRGIKTAVLAAGGFGYVASEAEYDELVEGIERELNEIAGTEREFIITWARKASP